MAVGRERAAASDTGAIVAFDLRPYPFQEEILDILAAEREVQNKYRHLVVAATGTGKTMIAAFDYARVCRQSTAEAVTPVRRSPRRNPPASPR